MTIRKPGSQRPIFHALEKLRAQPVTALLTGREHSGDEYLTFTKAVCYVATRQTLKRYGSFFPPRPPLYRSNRTRA